MKRAIALVTFFTVLLAGCGMRRDAAASDAASASAQTEKKTPNVQQQALSRAEQAGLLETERQEPSEQTADPDERDAVALVAGAQNAECDWTGEYTGNGGITLEILQSGADTFAYRFSTGSAGTAGVRGDTAKSEDGTINFLLSGEEPVVTVAGAGLMGNYAAANAEKT